MGHEAFWTEALPYAREAHAGTGVLISVILAQWGDETGFGGPDWSVHHNPGNVGSFDGQPVASFPSLEAGVAAYIHTMNLPYYVGVRAAVGWLDQCHALGRSPWASGHYMAGGPPPGMDLVKIITADQLWTYDGMPPSPPQEEIMPLLVVFEGSYWVVDVNLTSRVKVAAATDGSNLSALGYRTVALSAPQMAAIPVVG